MTDTNPAHKTWCYTANNYDEELLKRLKSLKTLMHRCCAEVGDTGNRHLQGAFSFKRGYRLTQLRKLLGGKLHFEPAKASDPENYCIKGDILIDIDDRQQGKRTDLEEALTAVTEGGMLEVAKRCPSTYVKYHKGLFALQQELLTANKGFIPTSVEVFWGPAGSGKSRRCYEIDPDLYTVPEPINGSLWFDGYRGQQTILFDDFYGWIKYHTLLQFTDGYRFQVPVKGAFVQRNWNKVLITSNEHPDRWYARNDLSALTRRITSVTYMTGTVTEVGEVILTPPPLQALLMEQSAAP